MTKELFRRSFSFQKKFIAFALVLLALGGMWRSSLLAEQDSSGNDFWVAFPGNSAAGANQVFLYIVAQDAAQGTVTYSPTGFGACAPVRATGRGSCRSVTRNV